MNSEKKERFLLIEDDAIDRFISSTIINKHYPNLTCVKLCDGQKAIDYLKESIKNLTFYEIRFIIVDIMMPKINGHEFLAHYQKHFLPYLGNIPVFIFSTSININDRSKCLSYPFVKEYIQKPISNKILFEHNLLKDYQN